jgi:hypothetical protein
MVKPTVGKRKAMSRLYYSAAWTDSGFLLGCSHEHKTVAEAASCILCAGGYVVGVQNGAIRSLTAAEEAEFQRVVSSHSTHNPAVEPTPAAPAEATVSDSGYAVMTRIRVGDRWTWATWMSFETYAEAAAHARDGNKVVRFRSPAWTALRQQTEAASPIVINAPRESVSPQGEGETLLEFVLRFLSPHNFAQQAEPISDEKHGLINTDMIDSVFSRLSESEICELERMCAEDKHALLEALGNRFRTMLKLKDGCH